MSLVCIVLQFCERQTSSYLAQFLAKQRVRLLPLRNLPFINIIGDGQTMLINLPVSVQRSCRHGGFSMRRPPAPGNGILSTSPEARSQVRQLRVWAAEPVSRTRERSDITILSILRGLEETYLRKPPLAIASAWAALSSSPRSP